MRARTEIVGRRHIVYDAARFAAAPLELFDPAELRARGLLRGRAAGRGDAWLFRHGGDDYALRHYRRGGWAARLLDDRYPWAPPARTRPGREAALLARLRALGLPVPAPAAWQVAYCGACYRADLITTRIPAAPLGAHLRAQALDAPGWRALGAALRRFHDRQVWHADLSLGNILIAPGPAFHLIDFDRARLRAGRAWKRRNLARLRRSCDKARRADPAFRFRAADFAALLDGYSGSAPRRRSSAA